MRTIKNTSLPAGMDDGRDTCNWCGSPLPEELALDSEMEGTCSLDCRYRLARAEGFVSDSEHLQYLEEGWAPAL